MQTKHLQHVTFELFFFSMPPRGLVLMSVPARWWQGELSMSWMVLLSVFYQDNSYFSTDKVWMCIDWWEFDISLMLFNCQVYWLFHRGHNSQRAHIHVVSVCSNRYGCARTWWNSTVSLWSCWWAHTNKHVCFRSRGSWASAAGTVLKKNNNEYIFLAAVCRLIKKNVGGFVTVSLVPPFVSKDSYRTAGTTV